MPPGSGEQPRIAIYYEHLFPESRGGGERLYGGLAAAWARAGAQVTYLTREHPSAQLTVARNYDVAEIVPAQGVYDQSGVRTPRGALQFAWATFRQVRERRDLDDCVYVSSTPALLVFAARAGLLGTRSKVLVVDWLEVWSRAQWQAYLGLPRGLAAWAIQFAAIWASPNATCHSGLVATRLQKLRPGMAVLRSPGLIDAAERRTVTAARHDVPQTPFALFVGRFIADKNVLAVPAAVADVRAAHPDFRCVIVGSGALADQLRERITEFGLDDAIELRAGVPQEELDALMAGAVCLLHPSQREGYGLVVVEAASFGTPSVLLEAPDNAATELLEPGVNGFLAADLSPQALGAAVGRVLDAGEPLRRSTSQWYARASQERSIQRTSERIKDFIERKLNGRQGMRAPVVADSVAKPQRHSS